MIPYKESRCHVFRNWAIDLIYYSRSCVPILIHARAPECGVHVAVKNSQERCAISQCVDVAIPFLRLVRFASVLDFPCLVVCIFSSLHSLATGAPLRCNTLLKNGLKYAFFTASLRACLWSVHLQVSCLFQSQTGIRQGDPLGPMLNALALHQPLQHMQEAVTTDW